MNIRFALFALLLMPFLAVSPAWSQAALGPVEGPMDDVILSPYDLNRVVAGDMAPDFRLQDENGKVHQLSQYRGKNVVLVMYRGYW
jgi:cytochrome oxidase Cu insertion factor (SCO1/SenC/PrrC family)